MQMNGLSPSLPATAAADGQTGSATAASGGIASLLALFTGQGGAGGEHPFAALLGEQISEVSPEVLRQALQSLDGEGLPEDGKDLPLEELMALLLSGQQMAARVDGSGAPLQGQGRTGGGEGGALAAALPAALLHMGSRPEVSVQPPADADDVSGSDPLAEAAMAARGLTTQSASTPATPSLSVDTPMGRPGWDQSVGQRVLWMVNQNVQSAEISINPPELGPVKVSVRMEGEHVHVSFAAAHGTAREALESALPRLREMFADAGLNLGQADVSRQGAGDGRQAGTGSGMAGAAGDGEMTGEAPVDGGSTTGIATSRLGDSLVDTYV